MSEQILIQDESFQTNLARRKLILKKGLIGLGIGTFLGLAMSFIFVEILHLLGFGAKGIVPGSIAAEIQAHMGNVTKGSLFAWCQKIGMKGIKGILGYFIPITTMIGGIIGVVKGKRNKLPATSFSGVAEEEAVENYVTNDETTEAVRIEDEQDIDLYIDPGTTNDDDTLALNNDLGRDAIIDEQNLLAIAHDEEERYHPGDNDRQLLIVL